MINYNIERFTNGLSKLDIKISDVQIQQFMNYYELLIEWNSFMNLTSITEFDEVITKHFIDSISLCNYYDFGNCNSLIDIGTGAGFPGIPLKIMYPDIKVVLLDSLNKRINFLNEVISSNHLNYIEAVHGRAEDFAQDKGYREQFDLCVSRAVANLSTLSEICIPFLKIGGKFISYKSEKGLDELDLSKKAIYLTGGKYNSTVEFKLPDSDFYRNFLIIDKVSHTPKTYPRKAGLPNKNPL